ncbi:Uncharacterised protein [Vibrio cholerae]|nr:Uncharacterised protein [Vibrio cholerae]
MALQVQTNDRFFGYAQPKTASPQVPNASHRVTIDNPSLHKYKKPTEMSLTAIH